LSVGGVVEFGPLAMQSEKPKVVGGSYTPASLVFGRHPARRGVRQRQSGGRGDAKKAIRSPLLESLDLDPTLSD